MWRFYLSASAAVFRARRDQLWQLVMSAAWCPRGLSRAALAPSFIFVIPAKAGIHFLFLASFPCLPSFRESGNPFCLCAAPLAERSSLLGFARHPWRASHFLCLHKESNQRNAPSVKRRLRRFAAVGRGLAAGHPALSPNAGRPGPHRVRRTRPCPADLRRFTEGQRQERSKGALSSAAGAALFFCFPGPLQVAASRWRKSPKGRRQDVGEFADSTGTYCPQNPGACSRSRRAWMAWMPVDRDLEGALSWVTFFGQAKKVTRPPGMAGETTQGRETVFA